ncbi:MAG: ABC transporter substrate-binding protein [Chloroflexota bacterium]
MQRNETLTTTTGTTTDAYDLDVLAHRAPVTDDLLQLADWLATNGPVRLSAIARIELAERLITRRRFLIGAGALGLGVITGCGPEEEAAAPTTTVATRIVEHAGGTIEVPANPQRVVVISPTIVVHLVSVDLTPVAADNHGPLWMRPYRERYDEDMQISEISTVGSGLEPNLEQIASIGPDLILTETIMDESIQERLAEIAPTVVIFRGELENYPEQGPTNAGWKPAFDQTVRAVGRQEEAEQWHQRYQDQVDQARAVSEGISVSFIRPQRGTGNFTLDGTTAFAGSVAEESGFTVIDAPEGVGEARFGTVSISNERLDIADGDVIVTSDATDFGFLDETGVEIFARNPLWETLPAVEADRVLVLPEQIYNGGTYAYAIALLTELREAVVQGEVNA